MALKPTIYKAKIALSDLDRHYYDKLNLTIAQHPSETSERMMVRLLAFCLNARPGLTFTKGLSTPDEPDIIARDMDDSIDLWIDVGEPTAERTKKATRAAETVKVYSFNAKSNVWWYQNRAKLQQLGADIYQIPWNNIRTLTELVQRTMDFTVTISEDSAYFSDGVNHCDVCWRVLQ